ncbi:MAG: DedA family protein [Pseudonocardiales bacterium]|nr:MAG: DedA family protein [Pseudonocardiales bacterium]
MTSLVDKLFTLNAVLVYVVVALLVFAEDALFVGFVLPGETAAVLGGVIASQGKMHLWLIIGLVVAAAIIGYEIGRHLGPRILAMRTLDKRRRRLDDAQDFLRRRGGWAVFSGRFVAFFRAVMPALAGTSRMPHRRFLAFNAAGGLVWGTGLVVRGFVTGNSYKAVEKSVGRVAALVVLAVVLVALAVWRIRAHRAETVRENDAASTRARAWH